MAKRTLSPALRKEVGARLRESRKRAGFKDISSVVKRLETEWEGDAPAQQTLSRYETGAIDVPITLLVSLAPIYKVSVDYLLGLKADPGSTGESEASTQQDEAGLLLMEFGAWLRRTVLKYPELTDDIATGIRRLINEVEEKRLPRAAPQDDVGEKVAS